MLSVGTILYDTYIPVAAFRNSHLINHAVRSLALGIINRAAAAASTASPAAAAHSSQVPHQPCCQVLYRYHTLSSCSSCPQLTPSVGMMFKWAIQVGMVPHLQLSMSVKYGTYILDKTCNNMQEKSFTIDFHGIPYFLKFEVENTLKGSPFNRLANKSWKNAAPPHFFAYIPRFLIFQVRVCLLSPGSTTVVCTSPFSSPGWAALHAASTWTWRIGWSHLPFRSVPAPPPSSSPGWAALHAASIWTWRIGWSHLPFRSVPAPPPSSSPGWAARHVASIWIWRIGASHLPFRSVLAPSHLQGGWHDMPPVTG